MATVSIGVDITKKKKKKPQKKSQTLFSDTNEKLTARKYRH